ncbi:hypothetical protein ASPBRDRAFT_196077 [Aspergillus brasiliensis CBS 101740]|uniref:Uncharacterized protein n=1 Tax=Aspergillus brasiliensis (strain CBS 101740 / IMI 381727 / IBT 21946) TaxID=767769 RepID=A0A1L9UJR6_ASPBC|nr:hypothetical protein ASPBRDRAFT_196077 [Aspergillus brasiliensis CBS 101740]
MAHLIQTLRARPNAIKKPTHGITIGNHSICLPLTGLANVDPTSIAPTLRAVFSVYLARTMKKEDVEELANWVKTLPPGMDISLDGVYTAGSMYYILSSAYSVYLKVAGRPGYKLVAEVTSHNLVRTLFQPSTTGAAGSSPQKGKDKKENVKPMPPKTS